MDDLVRWLGEQLDEDQRVAEAARGHGEGRWQHDDTYPNGYVYDGGVQPVVYDESSPSPEEAAHIAAHDPARVLREIDATRQIVQECARTLDNEDTGHWLAQFVLRREALRFSHRPGYREEWAP